MALFDKPNATAGEFLAANPEEADRKFFGRKALSDRRGFLRGSGLATMTVPR